MFPVTFINFSKLRHARESPSSELFMKLLFIIYGYVIILVWKGYSLAAAEYVQIFS